VNLRIYWDTAHDHFLVYLAKAPRDVQEYLNQAFTHGYRLCSLTIESAGVLLVVEKEDHHEPISKRS
jgi:hypothetical protein